MSVTRIRVELKPLCNNPSFLEQEIAFKKLLQTFKRVYDKSGIKNSAAQKEFYESPGRKRRRKEKNSESARLKQKLKENFSEGTNRNGKN